MKKKRRCPRKPFCMIIKEQIPKVTPHAFRRTFCTRMMERGIDVKSLQYITGHSDIEMSLNVYTRWNEENAIKAMKKVVV